MVGSRRMRRGMLIAAALAFLMLPAAAHAETLYGFTYTKIEPPDATTQTLVTVDSVSPTNATTIAPITGFVDPGERLVGIDIRPATGQLYGVTQPGRLYVINRATAVATQVGSGVFPTPMANGFPGVDFDPLSDQLRVFGNDQNDRIDPETGAQTLDTALAPTDEIPGLAYGPNIPGSQATAYATVFKSPGFSDHLVTLGSVGGSPVSPNSGQLFDVGELFPGVQPCFTAPFGAVDLDISYTGGAYFLADVDPDCPTQPDTNLTTRNLYTVDLTTGLATLVGSTDPNLVDIAAAQFPQTFSFDTPAQVVDELGGAPSLTVTRSTPTGTASARVTNSGGTATPGADYQPVDTTVQFAAGEQTAQLPAVQLIDDPSAERAETIELSLSRLRGGDASPGAAGTTVITINDHGSAISIKLGKLPKTITIKTLLRKGLKVSATPNADSELTFTLAGKPAKKRPRAGGFSSVIASKSLPLAAGTRSATLKPKRAKLRKVQQRTLQVTVTATGADGDEGSARATVRIKRTKR